MTTFKSAHVYYGQSRYDLNAELFPPTIDNPEQALPLIETAVNHVKHGFGNRWFALTHHFVPAFPGISPAYHIFMRDGINVAYVE